MNFLELLKAYEPNVSQIARDADTSRQGVYLWADGRLPSFSTFSKLRKMDKYREALFNLNYEELRKERPIGRPRSE